MNSYLVQPADVLHDELGIHGVPAFLDGNEGIAELLVCDDEDQIVIRECSKLDKERASCCRAELLKFCQCEISKYTVYVRYSGYTYRRG